MKNRSIAFVALFCALSCLCSCASTPGSSSTPVQPYRVVDERAGNYVISKADPSQRPEKSFTDSLGDNIDAEKVYGVFVGTIQKTVLTVMALYGGGGGLPYGP